MQTYKAILFLDYDEVLHPDAVYLAKGAVVLRGPDGIGLFESAQVLEAEVEQHHNVNVILSTSWGCRSWLDRALQALPPCLQMRVTGITFYGTIPVPTWQTLTRFEQISRYITQHKHTSWLAIDDDDAGWPPDIRQHLGDTDRDVEIAQCSKIEELRDRLRLIAGT